VEQPGGCPFPGYLPPVQFAGRPLENDVSPGDWIAPTLRPFGEHVIGSLVPPVFEAYARVFHPAVRYLGDDDVDVPWAEVAAANRTVAHPVMEWGSLTGSMDFFEDADQSPLWDQAPARGHLPVGVATALVEVLHRHTGTPDDVLFGVWSGFGFIVAGAPTLALPAREHWLLRGPLDLAAVNMAEEPSEQSASLWWPADRSWFVATDIDLVTTYIGGSAACIDDVVAAPALEAVRVPVDQRFTWDADTVNPRPLDGPG
jgi:hypothetical protein